MVGTVNFNKLLSTSVFTIKNKTSFKLLWGVDQNLVFWLLFCVYLFIYLIIINYVIKVVWVLMLNASLGLHL